MLLNLFLILGEHHRTTLNDSSYVCFLVWPVVLERLFFAHITHLLFATVSVTMLTRTFLYVELFGISFILKSTSVFHVIHSCASLFLLIMFE